MELGRLYMVLAQCRRGRTHPRVAQLGSRLVTGTAKKLSAKFFDNFQQVMQERQDA